MKNKEQKTTQENITEPTKFEQQVAQTKQATKKIKALKDSHNETIKNFLAPGRKIKKKA